jgi:hypothetical protein
VLALAALGPAACFSRGVSTAQLIEPAHHELL